MNKIKKISKIALIMAFSIMSSLNAGGDNSKPKEEGRRIQLPQFISENKAASAITLGAFGVGAYALARNPKGAWEDTKSVSNALCSASTATGAALWDGTKIASGSLYSASTIAGNAVLNGTEKAYEGTSKVARWLLEKTKKHPYIVSTATALPFVLAGTSMAYKEYVAPVTVKWNDFFKEREETVDDADGLTIHKIKNSYACNLAALSLFDELNIQFGTGKGGKRTKIAGQDITSGMRTLQKEILPHQ